MMSKYHPLFCVALFCLLLPGRATAQDKEENLFWKSVICEQREEVALYLELYPQGAYVNQARACHKTAAAEAQRKAQAAEAQRKAQAAEAQRKAQEQREAQAAEAQRQRKAQEQREAQIAEAQRKAQEAEAQSKARADYTNSIGMEFTAIPAGSFYMGSCRLTEADKEANKKRKFMGLPAKTSICPSAGNDDDDAGKDEVPQHKVHISKGFHMGIYEVTVGQFKQFITAAERYELLTDDFIQSNNQGGNHPVVNVYWQDAQAFIGWLNNKEGGYAYRLPTEAEWEYAARAGTTSRYSWGDSASQADDYAWYGNNSGGRTHAVGGKQANPWGLYDMHGNVWEWVADWYAADYYASSPVTDPQGPRSGGRYSRRRVLRGGSWGDAPRTLRSAGRVRDAPARRNRIYGFRLVQDLTP